MVARISFILIALFFVLMNILLWRSEIRGRSQLGSPIPMDAVWRKILTAPDDSTLEIRRRGQKIGVVHWAPNVGEELATGKIQELAPEGMVRLVSGYSIDIDGNLAAPENSFRFHTRLDFATNHTWKRFNLRLNFRPAVYVIEADSARQELDLVVEADEERIKRTFTFNELRDPRQLIRQLGGPLAETILQLGFMSAVGQPSAERLPELKPDWEARNDWMTLGHAHLRVYRVQARLFDRFEAVALISPVGEILRVELPGEMVLMNDAFL